jgi:hypothetical protein
LAVDSDGMGKHAQHRRRLLRALMAGDSSSCVWCRRPLDFFEPDATIDHVIPLGRGGPTGKVNALAACRACNGARGDTTPFAWALHCLSVGLAPNLAAVERALAAVEEHGREQWPTPRYARRAARQLRKLQSDARVIAIVRARA